MAMLLGLLAVEVRASMAGGLDPAHFDTRIAATLQGVGSSVYGCRLLNVAG